MHILNSILKKTNTFASWFVLFIYQKLSFVVLTIYLSVNLNTVVVQFTHQDNQSGFDIFKDLAPLQHAIQ